MAEQVELLRPLWVGGKRREKGEKVDVAEFDGPSTVKLLKQSGALKDAAAKKAEG